MGYILSVEMPEEETVVDPQKDGTPIYILTEKNGNITCPCEWYYDVKRVDIKDIQKTCTCGKYKL